MSKSQVDYVKLLSKDNFSVLEEIFANKFRKFISLYWLLEKYDDKIKDLDYNDSEEDILMVHVKVNKKSLDDILNDLNQQSIDESIVFYQDKNDICITITRHEE